MLKAYVLFSNVIGESADEYDRIADELKANIDDVFWNEKRGAYFHSRVDGKTGECITAYANVFALLTGFVDEHRRGKIINALLHDTDIPPITTPYMQAFKLSCMCEADEFEIVRKELRDYFGGMAKTGTSTFWETYVPGEEKEQATDMYGRPFGRSQCHLWGAGSILIIGKYLFGLSNDVDFGERFVLKPYLPAIANSSVVLPLKRGKVSVRCCAGILTVCADGHDGVLILNGITHTLTAGKTYSFQTDGVIEKVAFSAFPKANAV